MKAWMEPSSPEEGAPRLARLTTRRDGVLANMTSCHVSRSGMQIFSISGRDPHDLVWCRTAPMSAQRRPPRRRHARESLLFVVWLGLGLGIVSLLLWNCTVMPGMQRLGGAPLGGLGVGETAQVQTSRALAPVLPTSHSKILSRPSRKSWRLAAGGLRYEANRYLPYKT